MLHFFWVKTVKKTDFGVDLTNRATFDYKLSLAYLKMCQSQFHCRSTASNRTSTAGVFASSAIYFSHAFRSWISTTRCWVLFLCGFSSLYGCEIVECSRQSPQTVTCSSSPSRICSSCFCAAFVSALTTALELKYWSEGAPPNRGL